MPIHTHLAYAYPRKARESLHGRTHLVVDNDLHHGRLHRQRGDALCKPRSTFWGLTDGEDGLCGSGITCAPCARRYEQLATAGVLAPHGGKVHGPRVTLDPVHGGIVNDSRRDFPAAGTAPIPAQVVQPPPGSFAAQILEALGEP